MAMVGYVNLLLPKTPVDQGDGVVPAPTFIQPNSRSTGQVDSVASRGPVNIKVPRQK